MEGQALALFVISMQNVCLCVVSLCYPQLLVKALRLPTNRRLTAAQVYICTYTGIREIVWVCLYLLQNGRCIIVNSRLCTDKYYLAYLVHGEFSLYGSHIIAPHRNHREAERYSTSVLQLKRPNTITMLLRLRPILIRFNFPASSRSYNDNGVLGKRGYRTTNWINNRPTTICQIQPLATSNVFSCSPNCPCLWYCSSGYIAMPVKIRSCYIQVETSSTQILL